MEVSSDLNQLRNNTPRYWNYCSDAYREPQHSAQEKAGNSASFITPIVSYDRPALPRMHECPSHNSVRSRTLVAQIPVAAVPFGQPLKRAEESFPSRRQ